ncbi:ankyrin repeat-containing protein-like [Dorcoceras hygrometricum]|uniref:Ankyrin repeat-containing protein-like n=1 Tax=Dorcoceras hygrometricum TaxID=472368 RepID=A0A2Z7DDX5_9LAMI|nr:ankyrin repeat-containing protein-like [Dorcoceras hygrometricum]
MCHFTVGGGRYRQSGPRPETGLLRQPALEGLTISARTDSPRQVGRNKFRRSKAAALRRGGRRRLLMLGLGFLVCVKYVIMKPKSTLSRLNDGLGPTQRARYGPFNPYIPIRSTTIGKSRVAKDPIAMHISWRSNSDIASVTRQTHLPKTLLVLWPEICTLLSPQIAYDIHACLRAVNPRQRCIDSYVHRGLTQSRRLMTPSESENESK